MYQLTKNQVFQKKLNQSKYEIYIPIYSSKVQYVSLQLFIK